jgi:arylsulfatase A
MSGEKPMSETRTNRRDFLKIIGLGGLAAASGPVACRKEAVAAKRPNIVLILADDLGYGDLGSYGQTKIRTPHLDRIAAEGLRFTQHYSGSPVCAPARCTLLTGKHTGHAYVRDNDEMREMGDVWNDPSLEGQRPLPEGTVTVGALLQRAGYRTGAIGKWGLGGPGTTGEPNRQGFDHFYGYLCQRQAHNFYPDHLWRNGEKEMLEGNAYFSPRQKFPEDKDPADPRSYDAYKGQTYSFDVMLDAALRFIRESQDRPFFLYFAPTIPHLALQVPEDSLAEYEGAFPETPYLGDKGYLPHPKPRAAYAAMITRMDRGIGRIMDLLRELGLDEDTLVFFTSDNGPTFDIGGADSPFFRSAGDFRGLKGSLYEGGIRIPLLARWPGTIAAGATSGHISAFWDFLPTLAELAGAATPADTDGLSFLPTLLGKAGKQKEHDYLYWEYARKSQVVLIGRWKALRRDPRSEIEVYDLERDPGELQNVAAHHAQIVARAREIMVSGRTESKYFPLDR